MDINTEQMEFLADGRVSRVYRLKDNRVLKLLHATVPEHKVKDEYQRCRIISQAGVKSPKALELIEFEGQKGIIFEWAGKKDLFKAKLENPLNIASAGRFLARVHLEFLACKTRELPDIKEEAFKMIPQLPKDTLLPGQHRKLEKYFSDLPDGDHICHMDFHPGNIILKTDTYDTYQVIDWSEALKGAPEADIAMTCMILFMAETSPGTGLLLRLLIPVFRKMFEKYYKTALLNTPSSDITDERIKRWVLASAVFRMHFWNIESEHLFLKQFIQNQLQEL